MLKNKFLTNAFLITAFIWISHEVPAKELSPVEIFVAKEIVTLNAFNDVVEAVAIHDSKIIRVGSKKKLLEIYPSAKLISQ